MVLARLAVAVGLTGIASRGSSIPYRVETPARCSPARRRSAECLGRLDLVGCEQPRPSVPIPWPSTWPISSRTPGAELSESGRRRVLVRAQRLGVAVAVGAAWSALRVSAGRNGDGPSSSPSSGPTARLRELDLRLRPLAPVCSCCSSPPRRSRRRPALIGFAAFGASLTKETGYPFVVALGLVGLLLARRAHRGRRRPPHLFGLAGMVTRPRTSRPRSTCSATAHRGTPTTSTRRSARRPRSSSPSSLRGLVVAPNGGVLVFWPIASWLLLRSSASALARRAQCAHALLTRSWPAYALARDRRRPRPRARDLVVALRLVGVGPAAQPAVGVPAAAAGPVGLRSLLLPAATGSWPRQAPASSSRRSSCSPRSRTSGSCGTRTTC